MTTPDTETEHDEALDQLIETALAWEGTPEAPTEPLLEAFTPILAAIRRQAAADALTEAARSLGKTAAFMREQGQAAAAKGRLDSYTVYAGTADAYYNAANRLRTVAADKLAEGYEWQCASGTGCCAPVPDAGDLCNDCEANDYDDRWAE